MKNVYECRNPSCGNTVERYPSQVRSESGVYCSKECKGVHQSEQMKGEGNPNYRDGSTLNVVCECGKEKDSRSNKCAICSKRGYSRRNFKGPSTGEVLDNPEKYPEEFAKLQQSVNSVGESISKAMGGTLTSFSQRLNFGMDEFHKAILASRTFVDAAKILAIPQRDVAKAVRLLDIDVSHMRPAKGRVATQENVLVRTSGRSKIVKKFVLDNGLLDNVCSWCGQGPEWQGKPLTLELDHIDENHENNDLSNLRILCPNCHTQTPTYRGKRRE